MQPTIFFIKIHCNFKGGAKLEARLKNWARNAKYTFRVTSTIWLGMEILQINDEYSNIPLNNLLLTVMFWKLYLTGMVPKFILRVDGKTLCERVQSKIGIFSKEILVKS